MRRYLAPLLLSLHSQAVLATAPTQPALRDELLEMSAADQQQRTSPVPGKNVDGPNLKRLKEIVAQYGWPTYVMVGKDGGDAAWLLAQHADRDTPFQRKVLELMQPLLDADQASLKNYAYLYDRIHDPQRYGTQGWCVSREEWRPFEIEDAAGVNARRKQAGMPPLEAYLAIMKPLCAESGNNIGSARLFRKAMVSDAVDVVVDKGGVQVAGQTVATPESLLALLAERNSLKIRVYTDGQPMREGIWKILQGAQQAGVVMYLEPPPAPPAAP
ncbi:hypothetical protein GJ699_20860 [Duganella sp. FT80W]|uniref:Uncharacterized protein n=1 Tax=Duganella guangzhouensis TaxID=2666084 RepID=A0A6I2L3J8_9BURK|nr:DUF6624 domain-containing protein [Duganella guangzhouensis]MRW92453.1 hypothetical protein [Duganella guangzhouensis]